MAHAWAAPAQAVLAPAQAGTRCIPAWAGAPLAWGAPALAWAGAAPAREGPLPIGEPARPCKGRVRPSVGRSSPHEGWCYPQRGPYLLQRGTARPKRGPELPSVSRGCPVGEGVVPKWGRPCEGAEKVDSSKAARQARTGALFMHIKVDDLSGPEIHELLREHLRNMALHSPPESIHALDLEALRAPEITFWTVWEEGQLLGCGALRELDSQHAEIKSMRTSPAHLRKGVAKAMLSQHPRRSQEPFLPPPEPGNGIGPSLRARPQAVHQRWIHLLRTVRGLC